MLSEYNNSLSDLVYLFVDGETTPAQEELLFSSLASNPELQQELQEAILIRSTLEKDCSALAVPPETTATIFQKAGFGTPGVSSTFTVGSLIQGTTQILRSIALPASCAIGGAALTAMFFNSNTPKTEQIHDPVDNTYYTREISGELGSNKTALQQLNFSPESPISSTFPVTTSTTDRSSNMASDVEKNIAANQPETLSEITNNAGIVEEDQSFVENQIVENVVPISSVLNNTNSFGSNSSRVPIGNVSTIKAQSERALPLTFSVRGIIDAVSSPSISASPSSNQLNNLVLSLGYKVSENTTIGLEGGSQNLQYYTFENGKNDNATPHSSIEWLGAYYNRTFPILEQDELTPFTQISVGGTLSGPTGRFLMGLRWNPYKYINISGGIESSLFLYQNSSQWYSMKTVGFSYQVNVNF